jgi:hypothetical protein
MQQLRKEAEILVALRRACTDAAEGCRHTVRNTSTATSKKRQELAEQCKRLNDRMTEFAATIDVKHQTRCDFAAFMDACNLQMTTKDLVFPDHAAKLDAVAKLNDAVLTLRKLKKYSSLGAQHPLARLVEQQITGIDKARTILSETALDSAMWASIPNPILSICQEMIGMQTVDEAVEETTEQIRRLTFASEECAEQQAQAVQDGDMKLCEVLYFKKIALQESMVEVFNKTYAALDQHHLEAYLQPMKKVHFVHTKINEEIGALMKRNEAVKAKVKGDLRALDEAAYTLKNTAADCQAQFARFMQDCQRNLEQNQKNQDQCLAAIEELEKRLVVLSDERALIAERQISAVEKERRRLADVGNFAKFQAQHEAILKATLQNAEAAEEVTDIFDELMCNSCNQLEEHLRLVEEAVESTRLKTHESRLSHFRILYLTLGDLQYKKERNLEELDKKIAHTHIQQELAMETFNPKAKEFSQMKKDLVKVREEMESQLHTLQQKSVLHIEAFKPTEVALVNSGKTFLHPVEELDKMNRSRQAKLLEYHKLMGSDEREVEPANELQAIEDMRNQMQPRKPKSSSGGGASSAAMTASGQAATKARTASSSGLSLPAEPSSSSPGRRLGPN